MNLATSFLIAVLCVTLASIAYTDLRTGLIRNAQNASIALSGMIYSYIMTRTLWDALIGGLFGGGLLILVFVAYRAWRKRDGIGFGDVKFMAGAGTWVHWEGVAPMLVIASILGLIGAVLLFYRVKSVDRIAFGPYLATSLLVVFFAKKFEVAPWASL